MRSTTSSRHVRVRRGETIPLLYRGSAAVHIAGGAIVLSSGIAQHNRLAVLIGVLIVAGASVMALRPDWWATLLLGRHGRWIVVAALASAFAAIFTGYVNEPFFMESAFLVATAAAILPPGQWSYFAALAIAIRLFGAVLDGGVAGAWNHHYAAWLAGSCLAYLTACFFGALCGAIALRMRPLEAVAGREEERIETFERARSRIRAEHARIRPLLDHLEHLAASMTSGGEEQALLRGVLQSRRLLERQDEAHPRELVGLEGLLGALADSYSHLTARRHVQIEVSVAPFFEDLPVLLASDLCSWAGRALDNVAKLPNSSPLSRVRISVSSLGSDWLRMVVEDDGAGSVPTQTGEGTSFVRSESLAHGGRFHYAKGKRGVKAVHDIPLIGQGSTTLAYTAEGKLRTADSERITPYTAHELSRVIRATRWTAAAILIGASAFDVGGSAHLIAYGLLTVAFVAPVEGLLALAGLRGEHPNRGRLVFIAATLAIVASGVIPQGTHYTTNGWAAMVLLELAWRYGWKAWVLGEIARILTVSLTMDTSHGLAPAISAQIVLPLGVGLVAVFANRLMGQAEQLERRIGTSSERWSTICEIVGSAAYRHDVLAPVLGAVPKIDHPVIRRLGRINEELTSSLSELRTKTEVSEDLQQTMKDVFEAVLEDVVIDVMVQIIPEDPSSYPGAAIDRFGRRAKLLDGLGGLALYYLRRDPPDPFRRKGLRELTIRLTQSLPGRDPVLSLQPSSHDGMPRSPEADLLFTLAPMGVRVLRGLEGGVLRLQIPLSTVT